MSWHYTLEKIGQRIREVAEAQIAAREPFRLCTDNRGNEETTSYAAGDSYQACEQSLILHAEITVPAAWHGSRVYVGLEFGGAESLVSLNGRPAQAIDSQHHDLLLADPAEGGRSYELRLDAYTGSVDAQIRANWTGAGDAKTTERHVQVQLKTAELQCIDRNAEALFYDMNVAYEAAKALDANSREYSMLIEVLNEAANLLDWTQGAKTDTFYQSAEAARACLQTKLYGKYAGASEFAPRLFATGHAHIDTAWLWRIAHSRKKIERTFTTALALMERYPDYHFSASQPQQYAYLKEDNPAVYQRVKEAVAAGRWEPMGGMWVESDCNVVSGESLVRQFLYGQRFFEAEFGKRSQVVWLPDVFGYCAAFPQIIKKAGMTYFMTIKISWNQFNKPPYQTFEWEGIDGTAVLTHFSPMGGYNSTMVPAEWRQAWNDYAQKHLTDSALYVYGFGDGGGGPTRHMLETAERGKALPGTPQVVQATNEEFFEDLERQVQGNSLLPRWVGELYLEYHRGTYTSQGHNKHFNRHSEILLQTAEQAASLALITGAGSYPQSALEKAWKLTLLNQFHDIIPGSSIKAVYEDSGKDYQEILTTAADAVSQALSALTEQVPCQAGDVLLYNPLSWPRTDVAALTRRLNLPGQEMTNMEGEPQTLVALQNTPSLGYQMVSPRLPSARNAPPNKNSLSASVDEMENRFFVIKLDAQGEIESLYDKSAGREVLDTNSLYKGNALLSFEDKPLAYDAWDIDIFYTDKMTPVQQLDSLKVTETGPLRASIEIRRHFGRGSTLTQRISIYRDLPRIDFDTVVDWQERQTLLKAAFPVNVLSPRATYDIQFGNVERPTHWNTSWDWARFEVCAHKWADLSEDGYGVSLLSDCKYGWDIKGNVMRLTLLKGAISPDPDADRGRHRFAYALYPHQGDWRQAGTVRRSYEFNVPVQAMPALRDVGEQSASLPSALSFVQVNAANLIVETIKKAEDDDQALIVRLYEAHSRRGSAALSFGRPIRHVCEVNLLEEETEETRAASLEISGTDVVFHYHPYEIKTFRVTF